MPNVHLQKEKKTNQKNKNQKTRIRKTGKKRNSIPQNPNGQLLAIVIADIYCFFFPWELKLKLLLFPSLNGLSSTNACRSFNTQKTFVLIGTHSKYRIVIKENCWCLLPDILTIKMSYV